MQRPLVIDRQLFAKHQAIAERLADVRDSLHALVEQAPAVNLDLGTGNPEITFNRPTDALTVVAEYVEKSLLTAGATYGWGGYGEKRGFYQTALFSPHSGEKRDVHLGIDIWGQVGTTVYAPLDGSVHSFRYDSTPGSYGSTILLEHTLDDELTFYTLYGHLNKKALENIEVGMAVTAGEAIGAFGDDHENGNWPPHLHFQVIFDVLDYHGDFPGVTSERERAYWLTLCPDPNELFPIFG